MHAWHVLFLESSPNIGIGYRYVIHCMCFCSMLSSSSSSASSSSPFDVERPARRCLPPLVAAVARRPNLRRVIIDLTEELDSSDDDNDRAVDNMVDDDEEEEGDFAQEGESADGVRGDDISPPPYTSPSPYFSPQVSPFPDSPVLVPESPSPLREQPVLDRPWASARDYHAAPLRGAVRHRAAKMIGKSFKDYSDEEIEEMCELEQMRGELGRGFGGVDARGVEPEFIDRPTVEDRCCEGEDPLKCWWVSTNFGPLSEEMYRFQLEGPIDLGDRDGDEIEEKVEVGDGEGNAHGGEDGEGGDNVIEGREGDAVQFQPMEDVEEGEDPVLAGLQGLQRMIQRDLRELSERDAGFQRAKEWDEKKDAEFDVWFAEKFGGMFHKDAGDVKEGDERGREDASPSPNLNVNGKRVLSEVEVAAEPVDQRRKLKKKKFWKSSK